MQVDKLVFFAGQAAVQRHVNEVDLCEANVAAWSEMDDEEVEQMIQPEVLNEDPYSGEEEVYLI